MNPIKVKAYGLIELTKKQYIIIQSFVLILIVLWFLSALLIDFSSLSINNFRVFRYTAAFLDSFIVIGIIALLEAAETFFMLRAFYKKEKSLTK